MGAAVFATSYLNDFLLFSLGAEFNMNIRVARGFSIRSNVSLEMPHNQISVPAGLGSTEELITGQQEMETHYRFGFGVGFSFSFGSKHSSVLNPRFAFR